jgi:hypothetical protein
MQRRLACLEPALDAVHNGSSDGKANPGIVRGIHTFDSPEEDL